MVQMLDIFRMYRKSSPDFWHKKCKKLKKVEEREENRELFIILYQKTGHRKEGKKTCMAL